jgi:hypothetical protein
LCCDALFGLYFSHIGLKIRVDLDDKNVYFGDITKEIKKTGFFARRHEDICSVRACSKLYIVLLKIIRKNESFMLP